MVDPDGPCRDHRRPSPLQAAWRHADLTLDAAVDAVLRPRRGRRPGGLDAHLAGIVPLPHHERDLLVHAINERLEEVIAEHRLPYSRPIRQRLPASGALAALVGLIMGSSPAPPEALPSLAAAAGRALGVEVGVYLVDQEQHQLVPVPPEGAGDRARLDVEGSLAGRAFRTVQILSSNRGNRPRLWVPLLDGADRLGRARGRPQLAGGPLRPGPSRPVPMAGLAARGTSSSPRSPTATTSSGTRLSKPRRPSAELIWQQLPPMTAATEAFDGGRACWSRPTRWAVTPSTSPSRPTPCPWRSSTPWDTACRRRLMAGAALAGYRSARRDGQGVYAQGRAIDDALAAGGFDGGAFVTGILGELDVASGRFRYVNAGHPPPLLLRDARVVRNSPGDADCRSAWRHRA